MDLRRVKSLDETEDEEIINSCIEKLEKVIKNCNLEESRYLKVYLKSCRML